MSKMTKTGTGADPAEAVRRVYEREAGNYDQNVKLPERLLFAGGREWVCAQAVALADRRRTHRAVYGAM